MSSWTYRLVLDQPYKPVRDKRQRLLCYSDKECHFITLTPCVNDTKLVPIVTDAAACLDLPSILANSKTFLFRSRALLVDIRMGCTEGKGHTLHAYFIAASVAKTKKLFNNENRSSSTSRGRRTSTGPELRPFATG